MMPNKQKKLHAQKQRQKDQTKQLNIIRAKVGRPDLTDAEALFYQRALRGKETPLQHLEAARTSTLDLLNNFDKIELTATDEEVMMVMASIRPELKESVENAYKFITSVRADIEDAYQTNLPIIQEIDPKDKLGILNSFDALTAFEIITNDIEVNAINLMNVLKEITELCLIAMEAEGELPNG